MRKLFLVWCFTAGMTLIESSGLYGSWLVRLKEDRSPRAPGTSVAQIRSQKQAHINSFTGFLNRNMAASEGRKGPGSAESPSVKSYDAFWFVAAVRVSCRQDFLDELRLRPDVEEVIPDEQIFLSTVPSEENGPLSAPWLPGVEVFRSKGYLGEGIRIGVIDSGIVSHESFEDRIQAFRDFTAAGVSTPVDENGHGTHVAHLAAGSDFQGIPMSYAPKARLVVARALEPIAASGNQEELRGRLRAFASRILEAMQWMLDPDGNPETPDAPHVVNNSWGFPERMPLSSSFFNRALGAWAEAGILAVFAAGNNGRQGASTVLFPGISPAALTVGSHNLQFERSAFSSMGSPLVAKPDILAPGENQTALGIRRGRVQFIPMSGTSMAAPLVSGIYAAILGKQPKLEIEEFREAMFRTALDAGSSGFDTAYGHGILMPEALLEALEQKPLAMDLKILLNCEQSGEDCQVQVASYTEFLLELVEKQAWPVLIRRMNELKAEEAVSPISSGVLRQVRQRLNHQLLQEENPALNDVLATIYGH